MRKASRLIWVPMLLLSLPALAQDKIDLRFHPAKGDTRQIKVTLDQTITQSVRNAKQETHELITVQYTIKVNDVDEQGNATIEVRYDAVAFHAKTPTGPVDYDSSGPPMQAPPVASGMAALVGQGFAASLDPQGQVTQISGVQKMLETILSHMNLPEGMARTAAEKALRVQLNEQNLKISLQNLFSPFPDHPVVVNEQWARTATVNLGFPIKVESTYTLQSSDKGAAVIAVEGKAATSPNSSMDLGGMKLTYDLSGDQSGSMQIDQANGWMTSGRITQHLSGSATVRGPNTDPQTVPMTIDSKITSEAQK